MNYNSYFGNESKNKEYKIFSFNPILIDNNIADILLKNGKWVFNKSTIYSLKSYLNIYLPKYISSYKNPKSNLEYGEFYVGIDNNGIIHGIPYKGILRENFINNLIDKIFNNYLKFTNDLEKKNSRNDIKVEIIELKNIIKKSLNSEYINYNKEINNIKKEIILYNSKKIIWKNLLKIYTNKIHFMLNNKLTKDDIKEYIKEKTNYLKKNLNNQYSHLYYLCDVPNYWDMMSELNSNYNFTPLKYEEIEFIKNDNLNIFNWVTKWKDSKVSMLKKIKPKPPKKNIDYNYPLFLLSQVSKMIPYWCSKNTNLKLFILKISIDCKNKTLIDYKDISTNKWKKSYRISKNGEPISITYSIK